MSPPDFFQQPAKSGLYLFGACVRKVYTIIQLVIVAGIVAYATISLYRGDFEGAYATFPFLLFYYVWVVARKRRKRLEETDGNR